MGKHLKLMKPSECFKEPPLQDLRRRLTAYKQGKYKQTCSLNHNQKNADSSNFWSTSANPNLMFACVNSDDSLPDRSFSSEQPLLTKEPQLLALPVTSTSFKQQNF